MCTVSSVSCGLPIQACPDTWCFWTIASATAPKSRPLQLLLSFLVWDNLYQRNCNVQSLIRIPPLSYALMGGANFTSNTQFRLDSENWTRILEWPTGLLDWNTGLECLNGLNCYKKPFY